MNIALLCLLAAGLAGIASTLLELGWLRVASAALPGTLPAGAVVLPSLLLAWAAGAWVAGRRADTCRSCLALSARWLAAGAGAVLLAPRLLQVLLPATGPADAWARVLVGALPAAPAAFCLGGVLPLFARLRRDAGLPPARAVGGATAALTAGAAGGCLWYVPLLAAGSAPLLVAACGLLAAGVLCGLLSAWEPPRDTSRELAGRALAHEAASGTPGAAAEPSASRAEAGRGREAVFALVALAGGMLLVIGELALLRVIAQYHGDSMATSSDVLAAVHAGMAIGALALCVLPATLRTGSVVALLLLVAAAALLLPGTALPALGGASASRLALLFGVPLGAGAGSLVTAASRVRGAGGRSSRWGAWVGQLTALSTAGAAAGGWLYVWVLASGQGPGTGGTLRAAALVASGLALCVTIPARRKPGCLRNEAPWPRGVAAWSCSLLAVAVGAFAVLHPPLALPWRSSPDETALLHGAEGPWGVVSLTSIADGGLRLKVDNRFSQGGTGGSLLARRLGRIAATFRPDAQRALLLGLGAGHTLAGLSATTPAAVDCVERNAQILALQLDVPFEPGQVPPGGAPRIEEADARAWLAGHPRTYDLIVGDLFFPWMPGAGDLFSREEFLLVRAALRDGGVAVQWLPLHQITWPAFGSAVNAFTEAFPDARLFVASPVAGTPLVALVGGLVHGLPRGAEVDALLAAAPSAAGPSAAADVYDLYVADSWTLQSRFRESPADTLDAPWVEVLSLRHEDDEDEIARTNLRLLAGLAVPLDTSSLAARPPDDKENRRLGAELTARSTALSALLSARAALLELRTAAPGSLSQPDRDGLATDVVNALLLAWKAAPGHIDVRDVLLERANELTREDRWDAAGSLLQAALSVLGEARLQGLFGGILLHQHYVDQALAVLQQALEHAPTDRTVLVNLGGALLLAGGRDEEARAVLGRARAAFAPAALPALQGTALALLEGDGGAAPLARALLAKMPSGEPWAAALQRLIDRVAAPNR